MSVIRKRIIAFGLTFGCIEGGIVSIAVADPNGYAAWRIALGGWPFAFLVSVYVAAFPFRGSR